MANELHPIFGASAEYIPGLDMYQPLESQAKAYSAAYFEPVRYKNTIIEENRRRDKEFDFVSLLKKIPPVNFYSAFDKKRKESVSILHYDSTDASDVGDLIKETGILRTLNDKHFLEFYGTAYGSTIEMVYLVFEPFTCFLSQLLCDDNYHLLEPPVIKCIMLQLFNGLKYLHDKEIVHRDIATKNLVFTEKGVLKISNFRSARRLGQRSGKVLTFELHYQPVDMLLGSETFSTAVDLWSATCIFAELILKQKLYKSSEKGGLLKEIFNVLGLPGADIWPEFVELPDYKYLVIKYCEQCNYLWRYFDQNTQSFDLLRRGFFYNPKYRICADECVTHPYFVEDPKACNMKSFGLELHKKTFNSTVVY